MANGLLNNLKFYYKGDELSGTRVDSGPNGLDIPQIGFVGSTPGVLNVGVDGTGNTSNYLEAAHDDLFRAPGAFTLSYWTFIPAGTLNTNHPAVGHFNTTSPNAQAGWLGYMRNADDRHTFEVSADGVAANVVRVSWGSAPNVDNWEYVVCIFDPDAGVIKISVDGGAFVTEPFAGPIFAATAPLGITSARLSSHIVGLGDVDEIGGWDRALTDDDVAYLFGGGTPPSFDTFDTGPPAPPSNFTAVAVGPIQVRLTWDDVPEDEDHYEIQRREGPAGIFETVHEPAAGVTTLLDESHLTHEQEYCYRIRSVSEEPSDWSPVVCTTTLAITPSPPPDPDPFSLVQPDTFGGLFKARDGAGRDADRATIESLGFTIVAEDALAGETKIWVYGPGSSVDLVVNDFDLKAGLPGFFFLLPVGVELTESLIRSWTERENLFFN